MPYPCRALALCNVTFQCGSKTTFRKIKKNKKHLPTKSWKTNPKSCILLAVGSFLSAQNSPELRFRLINSLIQPSLLQKDLQKFLLAICRCNGLYSCRLFCCVTCTTDYHLFCETTTCPWAQAAQSGQNGQPPCLHSFKIFIPQIEWHDMRHTLMY